MSESISRRAALVRLAGAAATLALPRRARAGRRPNVVFILIDDLRWDAFSHLGHPYVETPHIDRLATEGARFENAFVNISLCSPSRAGFLTGCEPQRTRVLRNEENDLDRRLPTFPALLQRAGYETAYVGKWHQEPSADPRPGFDYWLSFRGQGEYIDPQLNENGRTFQQQGYMTDILTEAAVAWLRRERSRPFCLCLSHKAVHGPFTPAERHRGRYARANLPPPANYADDLADKPWWLRASIARGARREQWRKNADMPVPDRLPPTEWNPGTGRAYYETELAVDDSVGAVLAALTEIGVLDDTVLIFTSDNGFCHGEHRRGDKRLAYEESLRIPLLVRYPPLAKAGSVITGMTLNIDLCPTICELCEVDPPEVVHGRSLAPLLARPAVRPPDWRDAFLYQYFREGWLEGLPNLQAIRTERYKYIVSPDYPDDPELYDLVADPHELRNLARDPAHTETLRLLAARLAAMVAAAESSRLPPLPPPEVRAEVLLLYDLSRPGERVEDQSGAGRDGRGVNAAVAEADGRAGRRFDGAGRVELEPRLSPPVQGKPFWVRATVRAEQPDGVIVSHGGQTNGYSLELRGGRPVFAVRSGGEVVEVTGSVAVVGRWVSVVGALLSDGNIEARVDGEVVGREPGARPLRALPNEGLTVGADPGTRVGTAPALPFQGLLAQLAIGVGRPPAG